MPARLWAILFKGGKCGLFSTAKAGISAAHSVMIFNEDCIEGMKKLSDNSVDLILTDLPFNATACNWDKSIIDLSALWTQFKRILKPCCSTVLFANSKFAYKLIASNEEDFKYKWIWVKNLPTFFIHAKNSPMHKFEEILVFSDGVVNHASRTNRRMKYNPQGVVEYGQTIKNTDMLKSGELKQSQLRNPIRRGRMKAMGTIVGARPSHVDTYVQEKTGYPSDVLFYDSPHGASRSHPMQKPTDLLEFLIRSYTDEGDTVLDATMGSGSTGVAAIIAGRRFIGYEIDEKFFNIAKERIQKALEATKNVQKRSG